MKNEIRRERNKKGRTVGKEKKKELSEIINAKTKKIK